MPLVAKRVRQCGLIGQSSESRFFFQIRYCMSRLLTAASLAAQQLTIGKSFALVFALIIIIKLFNNNNNNNNNNKLCVYDINYMYVHCG